MFAIPEGYTLDVVKCPRPLQTQAAASCELRHRISMVDRATHALLSEARLLHAWSHHTDSGKCACWPSGGAVAISSRDDRRISGQDDDHCSQTGYNLLSPFDCHITYNITEKFVPGKLLEWL